MTDLLPSSNLVTFYGKMLTFSRIKLTTDDFDIIESQLAIVSPTQNSLIPIVIDSDVELDLKKLVNLLWDWGLQPIGVVKGVLDEQASKLQLALFPADGNRIKRVSQQTMTDTTISDTTIAAIDNTAPYSDTQNNAKQQVQDLNTVYIENTDIENLDADGSNLTEHATIAKTTKESAEITNSDKSIDTSTDTSISAEAEPTQAKQVLKDDIKPQAILAEATPAGSGLFGKSDSAKIFGEKISQTNDLASNTSDYIKNKTKANSKHPKSKKDLEVIHTNVSTTPKNAKIDEIELDGTITSLKRVHEAEANHENPKQKKSDTEKQAEEKIKRFSSRAEVIAKINEANKTNDKKEDESSDILEEAAKNEPNKDTANHNETNNQINKTKLDEADLDNSKADESEPDGKTITNNSQAENNKKPKKPELKEQTKVRVEYVKVYEGEKVTSRVYDQVLRSGQSINHVGGDLILTNSVNDGAEAITDNSLHIYGRGMGRLVAGATGDQDAQIFCQKFNPSLVSVAGTYMLRDNLPTEVIDKSVQVSYKDGEGLLFRVMDN